MEQLLFLLLLIVAALVNILVRWARQRAVAPPRDAKPERPRPAEQRDRVAAAPVRTPAPRSGPPLSVPPRVPPAPPVALGHRRRPVHRRLGRHTDIRRAIVMITVLAPCRALEADTGITAAKARR